MNEKIIIFSLRVRAKTGKFHYNHDIYYWAG